MGPAPRRRAALGFLGLAALLLVAATLVSQARSRETTVKEAGRSPGRLTARPHRPTKPAPAPGLSRLGLSEGRDGVLYVPRRYRPGEPTRLLVMLHGSGSSGDETVGHLTVEAERV